MSIWMMFGIAVAAIGMIMIVAAVKEYLTTDGWHPKTAFKDSIHDMWVFIGAIGAIGIASAQQVVDFAAWLASNSAISDKFTSLVQTAYGPQIAGIASLLILGLIQYYHGKEKSGS